MHYLKHIYRPVFLLALTVLVYVLLFAKAHAADGAGFENWLEAFRKEAAAEGISQQTVTEALTGVKFLPRVIELDRKQPESVLTFDDYIRRVVSKDKITKGRRMMNENKALLEKIGEKYGVQPRFIVALWGVETFYGKITGGFSIIDSLATLAYEGRRAEFFKGELIKALKIIDADHISAADMKGSWAGAMGQTQFMPSSFLNFAVDEDGDGKRDIWGTKEDVFASIANYLKQSGWNDELTWGREIKLPKNFDKSLENQSLTLAQWQEKGVRRADGGNLSSKPLNAKLIFVRNDPKNAFLVYDNYDCILK